MAQFKVRFEENVADSATALSYFNGEEHVLDAQEAQRLMDNYEVSFVEEVDEAAAEEPAPQAPEA